LEDFEMFEVRKLFLLLVAGTLCLTSAGQAANLISNGNFAVNPAPVSYGPTQSWLHGHVNTLTYYGTDNSDRTVTTWVSTDGYKILPSDAPGMQQQSRDPANLSLPSNGNLLYQYVPVTPGKSYFVHALWKGNISPGATGGGRSWAEVYVGFASVPVENPDPNTEYVSWPNILRYRKFFDAANYNYQNISPTGSWMWEDIASSPSGQPPAYYVPQSGQNFMVIGFLLAGEALTGTPTTPYFYLDNVSIVECSQWFAGDANQDCVVDFKDAAIIHSTWLDCSLDPVSACP
jgi:hypothetical protein